MKVVCDTDILSALAKSDSLWILEKAFPDSRFFISDRIYTELFRSKEEGFDFPDKIFEFCDNIALDQEELEIYKEDRKSPYYFPLSDADLEILIIARENDYVLISNDSKLIEKAEEDSVLVLDIYDLFRDLYTEQKLTKEEIGSILDEIELKDYTSFKDRDKIFE